MVRSDSWTAVVPYGVKGPTSPLRPKCRAPGGKSFVGCAGPLDEPVRLARLQRQLTRKDQYPCLIVGHEPPKPNRHAHPCSSLKVHSPLPHGIRGRPSFTPKMTLPDDSSPARQSRQDSLNRFFKLFKAHWLYQMSIESGIEGQRPVLISPPTRESDKSGAMAPGHAANFAGCLQPIDPRHTHIHEDQIRPLRSPFFDRLRTA